MKHTDIIQKTLSKSKISDIKYLEQGITNDNYFLLVDQKPCVIRIPKKGNDTLFDYAYEEKVLQMVAPLGIDVPLIYYNASTGIKVTEFINNAAHFESPYIERAADLIKTLHQSEIKTGRRYSIKAAFKKYQALVSEPLFDTRFAWHVLDEIENLEYEAILCHNDLVEGNFLFTDSHDYLIDYEYAKDNHPYFDIMSFITENDITDESERERFFQAYFGYSPNQKTRETLLLFERGLHVLWCEWGLAMYCVHQEQIYYDIAKLKYQRLKETYR